MPSSSLAVWVQHAGRAGRDPKIQADAILLAEQSMFKKISLTTRERESRVSGLFAIQQDSTQSSNQPAGPNPDEFVYGKKVDDDMQ